MRLFSTIILFILTASPALAREQIRIVGSSTVFPFVAAAAEQFGRNTEFRTPIVESTGTGGGFKLFCSGIGPEYPDMSNASREIKSSEIALCAENGIQNITELKLGYDGIVIANAINSHTFDLTKRELFLALARQVPRGGKLVDNDYKRWNELNPSLPDIPIAVYGPPPTSGTRDAFVELVMLEGCEEVHEYEEAFPDKDQRKNECQLLREDGGFIEAGENDNLIVQKLNSNPDSIGLFGFSFMEQNAAVVKGNLIGGVEPTFDNIASGKYGVSRSLFSYVKNAHAQVIPGIQEFAVELTSDKAVGDEGYLILKGLVPLPPEQHVKMKQRAAKLEPLQHEAQ